MKQKRKFYKGRKNIHFVIMDKLIHEQSALKGKCYKPLIVFVYFIIYLYTIYYCVVRKAIV